MYGVCVEEDIKEESFWIRLTACKEISKLA